MSNGQTGKRPDGQVTSDYQKSCQAPRAKIYRLTRRANHSYRFARPARQGALRTSRTRGGMRWTRQRRAREGSQGGFNSVSDRRRADERRLKLPSPELAGTHEDRRELWRDRRGRRSRVVLTPPCWRQVWRRCIRPNRALYASDIRKATVAKVQGSPGRSRISRNPSRRESRDDPVHLWSTRALLAHDRGCNRRPAFPAPFFLRRVKLLHTSGGSRRENADVYPRAV